MNKQYYYKIRDIEDDDKYSQYLTTDKKCNDIIENAIETWYGGDEEDNRIEADNVFECIEQLLTQNNIQWKWIKFNIINF
jgi:hypothetical protein